jgi:Mg2+/Co2+ transporter CorB
VRLTGGASRRLVRALGGDPAQAHALARTPEEIRTLVDRSNEEGMVEDDEREMIRRVLDCRDLTARQVMTPRRDIVAVPVTATLEDVVDRVVGDGHSRLPVYDANLDDIIRTEIAVHDPSLPLNELLLDRYPLIPRGRNEACLPKNPVQLDDREACDLA